VPSSREGTDGGSRHAAAQRAHGRDTCHVAATVRVSAQQPAAARQRAAAVRVSTQYPPRRRSKTANASTGAAAARVRNAAHRGRRRPPLRAGGSRRAHERPLALAAAAGAWRCRRRRRVGYAGGAASTVLGVVRHACYCSSTYAGTRARGRAG
jgi:hypothetical protein